MYEYLADRNSHVMHLFFHSFHFIRFVHCIHAFISLISFHAIHRFTYFHSSDEPNFKMHFFLLFVPFEIVLIGHKIIVCLINDFAIILNNIFVHLLINCSEDGLICIDHFYFSSTSR